MSLGAGDENVGISQGVSLFVCLLKDNKKDGISQDVSLFVRQLKGGKKVGISQEMLPLVCQWGSVKSRDIPRNIYGDMLPGVTKSGAGMGSQNEKRHFAKRISPTRIYR